MKKMLSNFYYLRFLFVSTIILLAFNSCKEDTGFRDVVAEISIDTPNYGYVSAEFELYTEQPYVRGTYVENFVDTLGPKNTTVSDPYSYAVGQNVKYQLDLAARTVDPILSQWVDTTFSSDVIIKVKANNKVIWTKKFVKGDKPIDREFGNIIIR
jgi:hypothetical protein